MQAVFATMSEMKTQKSHAAIILSHGALLNRFSMHQKHPGGMSASFSGRLRSGSEKVQTRRSAPFRFSVRKS